MNRRKPFVALPLWAQAFAVVFFLPAAAYLLIYMLLLYSKEMAAWWFEGWGPVSELFDDEEEPHE